MKPFDIDELRAIYDRSARTFDLVEGSVLRLLGIPGMRRRHLAAATGKVLDVAAGTGSNFVHLPADVELTAVDLSPGMLDEARAKAERQGRHAEIREMNALDLQFVDGSFDTVISSLSLCTIPNPVDALREMARVVKPGGRILLLEHGRSSNGAIGGIQDRLAAWHYRQVGCRWTQEPIELVREAGLQVAGHRRRVFGVFHAIEARAEAAA